MNKINIDKHSVQIFYQIYQLLKCWNFEYCIYLKNQTLKISTWLKLNTFWIHKTLHCSKIEPLTPATRTPYAANGENSKIICKRILCVKFGGIVVVKLKGKTEIQIIIYYVTL